MQTKKTQQEQRFRGPIPGQSMTAELNSRPWLNPPKYNTVEEAMEFYLETLSSEQQSSKLVGIIKKGMPLTSLAESITTGGVMQGLHSIDVAFLLNPLLVEFMKGLSELAKIKYVLDTSIPENEQVNMDVIREAIKEELDEKKEEMSSSINKKLRQDNNIGLMARNTEEK